jgi:hypothetical protein
MLSNSCGSLNSQEKGNFEMQTASSSKASLDHHSLAKSDERLFKERNGSDVQKKESMAALSANGSRSKVSSTEPIIVRHAQLTSQFNASDPSLAAHINDLIKSEFGPLNNFQNFEHSSSTELVDGPGRMAGVSERDALIDFADSDKMPKSKSGNKSAELIENLEVLETELYSLLSGNAESEDIQPLPSPKPIEGKHDALMELRKV